MVAASSHPLTSPYAAPRVASCQGAPVSPALDTTQIFHLIDYFLPFEVCLHYQLLPLAIDRDSPVETLRERMHLGMVDPHDRSALESAVRMAQYWNYRLIPKPAIVALGRDLQQINQDFEELLRVIATQQVS